MKFACCAVIAFLAACSQATVVDVLNELGQETILALLDQTGLTDALNGEGPFTVFLPKQEVFDSLPQEVVDAITADTDLLREVLLYHVGAGSFPSSALANELLLPTLQGAELRVNLYEVAGNTIATVTGVPIDLDNVDIDAGNGIVHLLDFVILNIPTQGTVDTLLSLPGVTFEALAYAATAVDLLDTINAGTDITLLAPVDSEGFSTDVVDQLLADPEALAGILLDHVADGTIFSIGIGESKTFTTLNGNNLVVSFTSDRGYVIFDEAGNELADVIAGDIPTTQGVVHLLDRPIVL